MLKRTRRASRSSAADVLKMLSILQADDTSGEVLLEGTHLTRSLLSDTSRVVRDWQEARLLANGLARGFSDQAGIYAGAQFGKPSSFGVLGFAMMCAPTLREAFETHVRYFSLVGSHVAVEFDAQDAIWRFLPEDHASVVERFFMDVSLISMATLCRYIVGTDARFLREVRVRREAHLAQSRELFESAIGCPVVFHDGQTELVFEANALEIEPVFADPGTYALMNQYCLDEQSRFRADESLVRRVSDLVAKALPDVARPADLARQLGIAERTLRKHLSEHGTNLREIVTRVRMDHAMRLLSTSDHPVAFIAEKVGFADVSSFVYAFQRYAGTSPGRWRRDAATPARSARYSTA
ncbi:MULTISPECIES: helix-turn-helix transcriptional regulator [unclassified Paraburkholderia]|uniref:helix-turn-helix transcriptional regulator n=1 Tax=unclassified Paraburkholderia TaxID=2615204 RepID=UPI0019802F01|nr:MULTISPECIES: AraC family transcriptional regulator [unclassified Paraburkholderia]MBN3857934.1 AraC family transcriptional regulator [Paraburkholderia sp. Ac-20340]